MIGVKRLDKVHNTTVLATVLSLNSTFLDTCFEAYTLHIRVIPANSQQYKTRSSSNNLHGLRPEINWSENQWTRGGIWRLRDLAWTCGRVCWSTTTQLERDAYVIDIDVVIDIDCDVVGSNSTTGKTVCGSDDRKASNVHRDYWDEAAFIHW